MIKRFAVFSGECYYPRGGMSDYKKSFETREEAELYAKGIQGADDYYKWAEVEDMSEYDWSQPEEPWE